MIISSVSRVLFFPRALPALRSPSRASAHLFAPAIFFHPLFLFSLRFKVVIFSRPPFFQPVLRFASLLIFFFGHSCAFVFEVQGLPLLLLEYFHPTSLPRAFEFLPLILQSFSSLYIGIYSIFRSSFSLLILLISFSFMLLHHVFLFLVFQFVKNLFHSFSYQNFLIFLSPFKQYIYLPSKISESLLFFLQILPSCFYLFLSLGNISLIFLFHFCLSLQISFLFACCTAFSFFGISSFKYRAFQARQSHLVIRCQKS